MTIFLSQLAKDQIHSIIDYLEIRWSAKTRDNFIERLQTSLEAIQLLPFGFPLSKNFPGLRKCVITPQCIAYYRVNESAKEIEIITVIDSRQNFTA